MLSLNSYIPTVVHTSRGPKEITHLSPGDLLYEYKTGEYLRVEGTHFTTIPVNIYQADYSDGRSEIYSARDMIYNGEYIMHVDDLMKYRIFKEINCYELEYHLEYPVEYGYGYTRRSPCVEPLFPDPYITGALLINGNYDSPYINLPDDRHSADQLFAHKYNLDFADKIGDGYNYYSFDGDDKSNMITWKDFFKNHDCYVTTGKITSPIIPSKYEFSDIGNRKKLIRGIFDVGYDPDLFPDSICITNKDEERLKVVQRILWSLGISSTIRFGTTNKLDSINRCYQLHVVGKYDGYPGFFYDISSIKKNLDNDNKLIYHTNQFEFKITNIGTVKRYGAEILKGYIGNVILEKKNALYLTQNFIPRVSV